jgi:metal-responsive CopG/Arc/MetJ family transcriptional regulator
MAGTSISLPTELEMELEKIMYEDRKSKSEVIRDALIPYLQSRKPQPSKTAKQRRRR